MKPRRPRNLRADLEKSGTVIPSVDDITAIEQMHSERHWPSLGLALDLLRLRWQVGERDEETAIRLLFLLWYAISEPENLTGLHNVREFGEFDRVFEEAGGAGASSAFLLLAVGRLAEYMPYATTGDEEKWQALAPQLIDRALRQCPDIETTPLTLHGEAGRYFRHQGWIA